MDDLTKRAVLCPEEIAARCAQSGRVITYLGLHENSARLGAMLAKSGLRPGDSIALLIDNSLHDHEIRWAARRLGLACITISTGEMPRMHELLEYGKAKALFSASKYRRQVEALPSGLAKQLEVIYVDGTESREIVDGYEWTIAFGEADDCLAVIAQAKGALCEAD